MNRPPERAPADDGLEAHLQKHMQAMGDPAAHLKAPPSGEGRGSLPLTPPTSLAAFMLPETPLSSRARELAHAQPRVTLASRLLTLVGSLLIGSPSALRMPADFYAAPMDRAQLARHQAADIIGQWRPRIFVDGFRRDVAMRTSALASLIAAVGIVALLWTASGITRAQVAWNAHEAQVAVEQQAANARAEQAALIAGTVHLVPAPPLRGQLAPETISPNPGADGASAVWDAAACASLSQAVATGYRVRQAEASRVSACDLPAAAITP